MANGRWLDLRPSRGRLWGPEGGDRRNGGTPALRVFGSGAFGSVSWYDVGMEYSGYATDWDEVVFRGDPESRGFIPQGLLAQGINSARRFVGGRLTRGEETPVSDLTPRRGHVAER